MPSRKILIGYLTFVTDDNKDRRHNNFKASIESLKNIKNQNVDIVNFDNMSSDSVREEIVNSDIFDHIVHFSKNLWDVSVIYAVSFLARKMNYDYCLYMYDDFIIHEGDYFNDCISFMESHPDVHCLRVPNYSFDNMKKFDPSFAPKRMNPDSIRHYNTITNEKLNWEGPFQIGTNRFFKNNWHYTSRPTMWRTDILLNIFNDINDIPVMQTFEGYAARELQKIPLVTGVLDGGAMSTVVQSERRHAEKTSTVHNVSVKKSEIYNEIISWLERNYRQ